MMIKPLFPDGFVNDSDVESPSDLSDDDESSMDPSLGTGASEGDAQTRKQKNGSSKRKARQEASTSSVISSLSMLSSTGGESGEATPSLSEKTVPLGQLLTNVVILEEVVKEVVAMAQVRRGLGVDKVRFL